MVLWKRNDETKEERALAIAKLIRDNQLNQQLLNPECRKLSRTQRT